MDILKLKSTEFSLNDFKSPTEEYYPVYGWFWNGPVTDERTEEQILEMKRLGIKAFCIVCEPRDFRPTTIPTLTDPNYLTDAYFERYKFAVKKAAELGMKCWLYDEGGWPSGGACGKVMLDHPEYARRTLDKRTVTVKGGEPYKRSEGVFGAFVNGDEMIDDGFIPSEDIEVSEYYSRRVAFETPGKPDIPDSTLAESTDYFIKITHERYKEFIKEYFGNTVTAVFTDEPLTPAIPFREELIREYEKEYAESPLPYLPAIFGSVKATGEAITAKARWFDLASRAFCNNFLLRCKKWANDNGLAFTGHLDRDDEPRGSVYGKNFHLTRAMRCMDVPGIDVIWRQIFPDINGKKYENRFFPRYASSAAAQNGTTLASTECFGVYGSGLTFDQMRFIAGFQAIRGVTLFSPMKLSYERRGPWLAGVLPSFDERLACHAYLSHFNDYLERLSYVMTRGERVAKTALYYPITNFWADVDAQSAADEFDALGFEMEKLGVDFDVLDDDVILNSKEVCAGVISMGKASYSEIIIPPSAIIPKEVKSRLDGFTAAGGRILASASEATRATDIRSGNDRIVAMRRKTSDGELICLFNGSATAGRVTLNERDGKAYLIDITSGRLFKQENDGGLITVMLEGGESAAIYLTERNLVTEGMIAAKKELSLTDFKMRRTRSFTYGDMYPENEDICEREESIPLGDWSVRVGKDFSGTCAYSASFAGIDGDAVLDLGDVRHTCEVILNGKSLGVKIMKPYCFEIKKEMLRDLNELEIMVTNTPANQQLFSKTFEKWADWQLTAYMEKQNVFDLDSIESGLFGPVKITY